jgi:DNA invertase Pin-like site-specific DNA recombinase
MADDEVRWAMVQFQGVMFEMIRAQTVKRLRKGRDVVRRQTGHREGPLPYGHDASRPWETAAIEKVKALRVENKRISLAKIAAILNADKAAYRTRYGKPWSKPMVKLILDRTKQEGKA